MRTEIGNFLIKETAMTLETNKKTSMASASKHFLKYFKFSDAYEEVCTYSLRCAIDTQVCVCVCVCVCAWERRSWCQEI